MFVLSICIPTYNRATYLDETLKQLTKEDVFKDTDDVEIVISDNCSDDNTKEICLKYKKQFQSKIIYYRQNKNISDKNFAFVLNLARGQYAKLHNDNLFFKSGELEKFVSFLKMSNVQDVVLLTNGKSRDKNNYICHNFNELLDKVSMLITWIACFCVKTKVFKQIKNPDRYANLHFSQVDLLDRLLQNNCKVSVYNNKDIDYIPIAKKSKYSVPKLFILNYFSIINKIYQEGRITRQVLKKHKERLLRYINEYSFIKNDTSISHQGYFKYVFPLYWKNYYFYTELIYCFLLNVFYLICYIKKDPFQKSTLVRLFLLFKINFRSKK